MSGVFVCSSIYVVFDVHCPANAAESLENVRGDIRGQCASEGAEINVNMLQIQVALPRDDERYVLASSCGNADIQRCPTVVRPSGVITFKLRLVMDCPMSPGTFDLWTRMSSTAC